MASSNYTIEPINVTGTPKEKIVDSRSKPKKEPATKFNWWLAQNDNDLVAQMLSTVEYLKKTNATRIRQASIFTRLFSGKPLYNYLASTSTLDTSNQLPIGRPTANVCYSCTDTLVSRLSQDRPKPTFLTDGGHYKERKLAKQLNKFIQGEFYRTKAYNLGPLALRDGCVIGDGFTKVFAKDGKVTAERTLATELLTDYNDAYYGSPRSKIQIKLVDRSVFLALFPDKADEILSAQHGNVDNAPLSTQTIADQFIIAEGWHLPSREGADDGRHAMVCSAGVIEDEKWTRDRFPFAKIGYNPNVVGDFSQGLIEILMPTQMEIYRQLIVGSQAFELMGTPRVLIEEMSKVLETSFNNRIGTLIKYRNTPPEFVNAESMGRDWLPFVQWLIQNAFQMSGISAMAAASAKPAGLNSGEAIRNFDDLQTDRFAALERRYQEYYVDLAHLMIDCAKEIKEETGSYSTVYPGKDGTREIEFDQDLIKDSYVIQCFEESSLPKLPEGRQAKLSEMLAAGEISNQEFRRLSNFPDLEQSDQLANALEERILFMLDQIVDEGKEGFEAPDPFLLDPSDLASTLCVNYINLYATTKLEEDKMQLLRNWYTQLQDLKQASVPPQPQVQGAAPQGQLPAPVPPQAQVSPTSNVAV